MTYFVPQDDSQNFGTTFVASRQQLIKQLLFCKFPESGFGLL
jgi:hypothetical protein